MADAEGWSAPGGPDPGESRLHYRLRQAIDALVYGVAFTLVTVLLAVLVAFPLGTGWLGVELFLFLVGVALLGYASFQLQPSKRWDVEFEDDGFEITRPNETALPGVVTWRGSPEPFSDSRRCRGPGSHPNSGSPRRRSS